MKQIDIVLQARQRSIRLPNKIFRLIGNQTLIEIIIKELIKSKQIKRFFIATSKLTDKKKFLAIAKKYKCVLFFGSENNVLDRFKKISKKYHVKHFLRLTGDNIFLSHKFIDHVCKIYKKNNYYYFSNLLQPTFPEGYTFEIFSYKTLKKIVNSNYNLDKEHVTTSVVKGITKIKYKKNFFSARNLSNIRLTCDNIKDYNYIKKLFLKFKKFPDYNVLINYILKNKLINKVPKKPSIHYSG